MPKHDNNPLPLLGRTFQVERCLGKGGFGEVYLAHMTNPGGLTTRVALKVLRNGISDGLQAVQRLRDEGRLLSAIEHPNILGVRDVCVLDGQISLVTEYVEGEDLSTAFRRGDLDARALVQCIGQVASALDQAFRANGPQGTPLHLVHRDIKPSNIRLGVHGQVKLLDFGIARSDALEREAKTATQMIIGTMGYLAPERLTDNALHPASDVFALGVCLWEGIEGKAPFKEMGPGALSGMMWSEERYEEWLERRLTRIRSKCDPRILRWIERTMAYNLEHRPTAEELAVGLEALAEVLPGPALSAWARGRSWTMPPPEDGPWVGLVLTDGTSPIPLTESTVIQKPPVKSWIRPVLALAIGGVGSVTLVGLPVVVIFGAALGYALLGAGGVGHDPPPPDVRGGEDLVGANAEAEAPISPRLPDGQSLEKSVLTGELSAPSALPDGRDQPPARPESLALQTPLDSPPIVNKRERKLRKQVDEGKAAPPTHVIPPGTPTSELITKNATRVMRDGIDWPEGRVPAGEYEVYADFGSGEIVGGTVICEAEKRCPVFCNPLLMLCFLREMPDWPKGRTTIQTKIE